MKTQGSCLHPGAGIGLCVYREQELAFVSIENLRRICGLLRLGNIIEKNIFVSENFGIYI